MLRSGALFSLLAITLASPWQSTGRADPTLSNVGPSTVLPGASVLGSRAEPQALAGDDVAEIAAEPFHAVDLEDPSGQALASFYAALRRAKHDLGQAHIVFYGDSHTAPDLITGRLRRALQEEFGDAGAGFVMPGKPWPHHRHTLLEYVDYKGFKAARIKRSVRSGQFGLFGATLRAQKSGVSRMHTRGYGKSSGHASEFELYYLKQPGGGRLRLTLDGKPVGLISTRSNTTGSGYFRFKAKDGEHDLILKTLADGPVTLLGLTLERKRPGVVLDTLGIPGARAKFHMLWDDALYREQLSKRTPDLVVLAYGTNEAGDEDLSLIDYEKTLRQTLARIKAVAPRASCLLLGPTDRPERLDDGRFVERPQLNTVQALQRKLAVEHGCAFFDVVQAMGGPLSIVELARREPAYAARDYVHLTLRGYEALGDALHESLLRGYRAASEK